MDIRSLQHMNSDQRYQAFRQAFVDYEMQLNQEELDQMLQRRGFVPALSFGAFDQDRLVAFTFNGIGSFGGKKTAYDTGTGTLPEYRGQGLATQIFNHSIPWLKKAGIKLYLLEVLQHNEGAVKLYQKLGFEATREFRYFMQQKAELVLHPSTLSSEYLIADAEIRRLIGNHNFSDFIPSWQNSNDSILRGFRSFRAQAVYHQKKVIAYCIYEPASGDVTSLAVAREHRRKGLGTSLLAAVIRDIPADVVKVINIPADAEEVLSFLSACHFRPTGKQFEMVKILS